MEVLDGDELRKSLRADQGFSAKDRLEHARRVIFVSKLQIRSRIIVIVPPISSYRETRRFARHQLEHFVEAHVKCPN